MCTRRKIQIVLFAIASTIAIMWYFQVSTGNIAGILFFVVLLYFYTVIPEHIDKRYKMGAVAVSLVFSLSVTIGKFGMSGESTLDALHGNVDYIVKDLYTAVININNYTNKADIWVMLIMWIGIWIFIYNFCVWIFKWLDTINIQENKVNKLNNRIFFACVLIICWIPYYIYNLPGVINPDVVNQIAQIEGDYGLNNHFSVVHTLTLKIFYVFGQKCFGSNIVGISLYTAFQLIIMALILSQVLFFVSKKCSKLATCILLMYYALSPLVATYSVVIWKDSIFATFVIWLSIILYDYFTNRNKVNSIQLIFCATGMCLLRSNGLIAYIVLVIVLLLMYKTSSKKSKIILIIPIVVCLIIEGPIYKGAGIDDGNDIVESLSIPLQHIARVVAESQDSLTNSEIEMIERLAPLEEIKEAYNSRLSDPIKCVMWNHGTGQYIENNKMQFAKIWITLGIKHPTKYLKAWIDATVGYWYPDVQYDTIWGGVFQNEYGIKPIYNKHKDFYGTQENLYRVVPLLGNLFSIGSMFLILIFCIGYFWVKRDKEKILLGLPSLMMWGTIMIATPVYAEMRYVFYIMLVSPLMLCIAISKSCAQENCAYKDIN